MPRGIENVRRPARPPLRPSIAVRFNQIVSVRHEDIAVVRLAGAVSASVLLKRKEKKPRTPQCRWGVLRSSDEKTALLLIFTETYSRRTVFDLFSVPIVIVKLT